MIGQVVRYLTDRLVGGELTTPFPEDERPHRGRRDGAFS